MPSSKRTLKRQLNLLQVIMLGTAGTLGSGIFVLTGLAAGVAGPATFLAILIGGFLSFSIALNYCELATVYPETGGAMTYVREAWGKGLLSFLVGSMDSISSTFYCALSAVGFAYSLSVFFPALPIIPVAVMVIVIFSALNILGVVKVGNTQIVMGAGLLFAFAVFIIAGLTSPNGFHPRILFPDGRMFVSDDLFKNVGIILKTLALIYAAYVGFEVIADDAEEVKNPNKNIPIAILVSLLIITLVYSLTVLVTLGTVPWQSVAGSKTALSDAIRNFLPGWGVTLIGVAGMVGALTSVNSSMLSATRESFTLSRDGAWPLVLSRLNRVRVPFMAILLIGVISVGVTVVGLVDFLSYITSAGYLFVLFFSNGAMIELRRKYPNIHRPFKVPLFPLTPILASLTCVIVIFFSDLDALLFTAGVVGLLTVYYFTKTGVQLWKDAHHRSLSPGRWRVILPVSDPNETEGLLMVGSLLAEAEKDLNMCLLNVLPNQSTLEIIETPRQLDILHTHRQDILERFIHYAVERNVPMYTKMISAASMVDGVMEEIRNDDNVKLVLLNWPENPTNADQYRAEMNELINESQVSVAFLRDRGIPSFRDILVPVGGGLNSRMAIHLANDIAMQEGSHVNYLRVVPPEPEAESDEDLISYLQEIILTQLGQIPGNATLQIASAPDVSEAILNECRINDYGLVIIGSADIGDQECLFGQICNTVVEKCPYSVLVVHRHEGATASWLRHQTKRFLQD
jgi:APA family basic amino acid/polyamine antiporter